MKTNIPFRFAIVIALFCSASLFAENTTRLVILHTNDTHSQVEPLSNSDMGGYARRLGVITQIRAAEKNVLLFDSGDFLQGTPYFNFYGGRVEVEALNQMRYDAVTLGNHEFDNGMDSLATILRDARFPVISANYDVSATVLKPFVKPFIIIQKGGLKIGVFGLGVNPEGLVFQQNYAAMIYTDPVRRAVEISNFLREKERCDLVVCLSHLGAIPSEINPTDFTVAAASTNIDVILGGHSHQLIENTSVKNAAGKPVIIAQMGKSGMYLGRIDLTFEKKAAHE